MRVPIAFFIMHSALNYSATYKFTYPEKNINFNEKEYIAEEKKIIIETNKFLNSS